MDGIALSLNVRNKKSQKRRKDIISNLPESILTHILSFLPTKDAVRSSVLSSTWKYKWTSLTNFHFDYESHSLYRWNSLTNFHFDDEPDSLCFRTKKTLKSFINFVDKMLLHSTNSTFHNFFLSFSWPDYYDESRIIAWISALTRRKVQSLDIKCAEIFSYPLFPQSLFSCDSLIKLKIHMSCTLNFPTSVCLSNLRILDLFDISIENECFPHSTQLSLSFPVLKEFKSLYCKWYDVKIVDFNVPALDNFTWEEAEYCYHGYCYMLDRLSYYVIKIDAPSLTKFKYGGELLEDFILSSPSSIIDATLKVSTVSCNLDWMQELCFPTCRLLREFTGVKHLTLSYGTTKVLSHVEDLKSNFPVFDKLTNLKLTASTTDSTRLGRTMMAIFRSSPNLECLILNGGMFYSDDNDDLALEMVPQCFLSHLKAVTYQNFDGMEPQLSIVKFFLKNVKVLEEITITASLKLNSQSSKTRIEEVKKQLVSVAKTSSSHALIVFDLSCRELL